MSAEAAEKTKGPGIVLQPEEGQSYWQPIWANGYSIVKLSAWPSANFIESLPSVHRSAGFVWQEDTASS